MKKFNVAVVGVGAVGEEMIRVLKQRNFPVEKLRVFARSARTIQLDGTNVQVEELKEDSFKGVDIALFAGTEGEKGAALTYATAAIAAGAVVIDNGADFRMKTSVPLVVPEANPEDIKKHKGIIANPNCSTIQMVVALAPIKKKAGLKRVIVSTYQAVSGSGRSGIIQAEQEFRAWATNSGEAVPQPMGHTITFNVIPQIGSFNEDGFTTEEMKLVHETHKILHDKTIKISATTIRVPVRNGHSESVYIETKKPMSVAAVRKLLSQSPGICLMDDPANKKYPMPIHVDGKDDVYVGRIRKDPYVKNGLWLWIVADNLRKGAALNAVQIAEELIK